MTSKIEIITIGNELLEGSTVNTNVAYVCKKLYQAGYLAQKHCSVLDQKKDILNQFEASLKRSDVVICSGGLGPTQDDITLEIAAKLFNSEFFVSPQLLQNLKKNYGDRFKEEDFSIFASVPKKAELMLDQLGMAPGFIFKKGKKRLILLPGVPYEFEHLVDFKLIPYLKETFPLTTKEYKKVIHLCRVAESHIVPVLDPLLKANKNLSVGIYPKLGILSVHLKIKSTTKQAAEPVLAKCVAKIKQQYRKQWFSGKFDTLQAALHDFLKKKQLSLALAESCTGGALAASLVHLQGASQFFKGAIVSYDNEAKHNILKVKSKTLTEQGAVSEQCVIQMARNAQKIFNSDIAIATSGVAGPTGATKEKPLGYVWYAIVNKDQVLVVENLKIPGGRKIVIQRTINYALAQLWLNRDNI